jgi:hypothetical protein
MNLEAHWQMSGRWSCVFSRKRPRQLRSTHKPLNRTCGAFVWSSTTVFLLCKIRLAITVHEQERSWRSCCDVFSVARTHVLICVALPSCCASAVRFAPLLSERACLPAACRLETRIASLQASLEAAVDAAEVAQAQVTTAEATIESSRAMLNDANAKFESERLEWMSCKASLEAASTLAATNASRCLVC